MPDKVFRFYPRDEQQFLEAETQLRHFIKQNKPIPPETASLFLELLYSKEILSNELSKKYLDAVKAETVLYFKGNPTYWFIFNRDGKDYSLENWIELFFEQLKQSPVFPSRSHFVKHIVSSLRAYIAETGKPLITTRGIYVVTGFISAMLQLDILSPSEFKPEDYSYQDYNTYLYMTIRSIAERESKNHM